MPVPHRLPFALARMSRRIPLLIASSLIAGLALPSSSAHATSTAGTLAGEAAVDGGAATYTVPITVPPGRAGLQPSLSLSYNSRSGDGIAGLGWSLSGLSSIHRCPQTVEQDGQTVGVSYTMSDRLCLDGQRLVRVGGSAYGTAGAVYSTEIESYVRVTQYGGDIGSGTACFTAEEKSGRVLHYGSVVLSSPACASISNARVFAGGVTQPLSWLVARVEDRAGNYESYTYSPYGVGEQLLTEIRYTERTGAAGDRKVTLTYDNRATLAPGTDVGTSYLAGGLTQQTQALKTIATSAGGQAARTYTLTYATAAGTGRLLLSKIKECGSDGVCHPETVFTSNSAAVTTQLTSLQGLGVVDGSAGGVPMPQNETTVSIVGDFDGDGGREIAVRASDATAHTYLVQMTSDRQVVGAVDLTGTEFTTNAMQVADIDSDGRADIVERPAPTDPQFLSFGIWNGARGQPITDLTPANGTPAQNAAALFTSVQSSIPYTSDIDLPLYTADVDGDGRLDIVVMKRDPSCDPSGHPGTCRKVYAYLNQTTGSFANARSGVAFSTAKYLFDLVPNAADGSYSQPAIDHISDFDGDGLPDFFLVYAGTGIGYETGNFAGIRATRLVNGVLSTQALAPLSCSGMTDNECNWNLGAVAHWLDVNGDGLEDFVIAKPDRPTWYVRLNKGGGVLAPAVNTGSSDGLQKFGTVEHFRYAGRMPVMDADGDGKPDLLIPSVTQGFAARMCTIQAVPPILDTKNQPPYCPGIGDQTRSIGDPDVVGQCPVLSCSDDIQTGTVNLPANPGGGHDTYNFQWGGLPAFPAYAGADAHGAPSDNSVYHLAALKFQQASNGSISTKLVETSLVSSLRTTGSTRADDLFGDGLNDLMTSIGCTKGQNTFTHPTALVTSSDNCVAVADGTYGPIKVNDGPNGAAGTTVAYLANHAVLYANLNQGVPRTRSFESVADMQPVSAVTPPLLPDLLASATNGVGDKATWDYAPLAQPLTQYSLPLYTINGDYADNHHYFFTSSMPVVTRLRQSNGIGANTGARSAIYGYDSAIYNHLGRGFQGFLGITSITYTDQNEAARRVQTKTTYKQKFPLAGKVSTIERSTAPTSSTRTLFERDTDTWICGLAGHAACLEGNLLPQRTADTVVSPVLDIRKVERMDPATGAALSLTTTTNRDKTNPANSGWDDRGNLVHQTVVSADQYAGGTFVTSHTVETSNTYAARTTTTWPTTNSWWLDKLDSSKVDVSIAYANTRTLPNGTVPAPPARSVTTSYTWNDDRTPATKAVQGNTAGVPRHLLTTTYDYTNTTGSGLPSSVSVSGDDLAERKTRFEYTSDGTTVSPTGTGTGYFVLNTFVTNPTTMLEQVSSTQHARINGQVTTATDANGLQTVSTYDGFDRLSQVAYKDNAGNTLLPTATLTYATCNGNSSNACSGTGEGAYETSSAWRVMRAQSGTPTTVDWFDILGRPVKHAAAGFSGSFNLVVTNYDEMGGVSFASVPFVSGSPKGSIMDYDALGRITSKNEDRDLPNLDVSTIYAYAGSKTVITVNATGASCNGSTSNLCMSMSRSYDVLGRLEQTTQAVTGSPYTVTKTDYWYDGAGNPVAAVDAEQKVTTAEYNDLGRRTKSIDPDAGTSTYTYDALGELLTKKDARLVTTTHAYDTLGRITSRVATNNAATDTSLKVISDTWVYDPAGTTGGNGLLDYAMRQKGPSTSLLVPVWKETSRYEPATKRLDTLTSKLDGQANWSNPTGDWVTSFDYDTNGKEWKVTYPSGLVVEKTYAANGDLRRIGDASSGVEYWTATSKDAWDNLTGETYGGTVTGAHQSDAATGQVHQKSWSGSTGLLDQWTYAYDSLGNLTQQVRSGTMDGTENYVYDNLQRLKTATRVGVSGNPLPVSYAYTASGSLESKSDFGTYTYGGGGCGPHAVSQVTGDITYTYQCDASGNVIGGTTLSASYDFNNQPWQISRTGGGIAQFAYTSNGDVFEEATSSQTTWFGAGGYERSVAGGSTLHRHELGPVLVLREEGTDTVRNVFRDRLGSQVMISDGVAGSSLGAPVLTLNPAVSTNGLYTVSWTTVSGTVNYVLTEQPEGGSPRVAYSGSNTTWSPTSPKAVGNYYYTVQACDGTCGAASSQALEIVTPAAPVLSVDVNPSTNGMFTLSWTGSPGAQSYALEEKPPGGNWGSISTGSLDQSWSPPAPRSAGIYSYRVHACTRVCGAYSNQIDETVQGSGLAAPNPISVNPTTSTNGAYTVTWTPVGGATSYVLYEQVSGTWTPVPGVSGTSKQFTSRSNGDYPYYAVACNASGCSAPSSTVTAHVALVSPPGVPTVSASPNPSDDGNYTVTWTTVSGTGITYILEGSSSSSPGNWQVLLTNTTGTTWSPSSPKPDGSYGYRAKACKPGGICGNWSNTYTEVVKHLPDVPGPISISPSPSTGHYTVSWGGVAGALSYWLEEKVNGGAWHQIDQTISSPSYSTDQGNGTYAYRVRACALMSGQIRCSAFTAEATVVVNGSARPPMPESITSSVSVCPTHTCTYTISWAESVGAVWYELHETTDVTGVDRVLSPYTSPTHAASLTRSAGGGFAQVSYSYEVRACAGTTANPLCSPYRGRADVLVGPNSRVASSPVTRSYDAFGKVREGDFSDHVNGTLDTLPDTLHGFTDHNHVDDVRLIHMGGRMYDYQLGRFLNVDPVIQFPTNTQSLNPYSYILNNPLAGKDPSGFSCQVDANAFCDPSKVLGGTPYTGPFTWDSEGNGAMQSADVRVRNQRTGDASAVGSLPVTVLETISVKPGNQPEMDAWDGLPYRSRWGILPGSGLHDFGRDIYDLKSGLGHFMSLFNETQYGPIGPYRLNPLTGQIHQPREDMDTKLGIMSMAMPVARTEQAVLDVVAPVVEKVESAFVAKLVAPAIKAGAAGGETAGKVFPQAIKDAANAENPLKICVYCQREGVATQVDHAIPRARGGNATLDNAQLACPHCNASKGARDFPVNPPPDYFGQWPPAHW